MYRVRQFLCGLVAAIGLVAAANAGTFSFPGTITRDDQMVLFGFTVGSTSAVTMETFGYAGGTNLSGIHIPAGGFDPVLSLFSSTGTLIDEADDGSSNVDPVTGAAFDSLMTDTLTPGKYFISLSESYNFAVGPTFSSGFLQAGTGNFTAIFGCSNGRFCDATGANRTNAFDVSISGPGVTTAPEPASMALVALGLLGVGAVRRKKRVTQE